MRAGAPWTREPGALWTKLGVNYLRSDRRFAHEFERGCSAHDSRTDDNDVLCAHDESALTAYGRLESSPHSGSFSIPRPSAMRL